MTLPYLLPVAFAPAPYTALDIAQTPYTAVQLAFHAGGSYAPDGDSIRMKALRPNLWPLGVKRSKKDGTVQSRMEGMDALELHFYGYSQPLLLALAARDHLLKLLGVSIQKDGKPSSKEVPGWALTRSADIYGRCIAFLFPQNAPLVDGAKYMAGDASFLDILRQSANVQMLSAGMAYPMFYELLPTPIRGLMREEALKAREKKIGVWAEDQTLLGAHFFKANDVEEAVFYPKLARRLFRYFSELGKANPPQFGLGRFSSFLEAEPDLLHLASEMPPDGEHAPTRFLHGPEILEIDEKQDRLRLLVPPEDIVWHEKMHENPLLPRR
ncbi:MAG: hypothetical protein Q8P84_01890 [Deltaproteobacteria bacterium]|nr:hypothetical protein [Deltaproteobacteria bacterium]